jgi:hypothetical protein
MHSPSNTHSYVTYLKGKCVGRLPWFATLLPLPYMLMVSYTCCSAGLPPSVPDHEQSTLVTSPASHGQGPSLPPPAIVGQEPSSSITWEHSTTYSEVSSVTTSLPTPPGLEPSPRPTPSANSDTTTGVFGHTTFATQLLAGAEISAILQSPMMPCVQKPTICLYVRRLPCSCASNNREQFRHAYY